MGCRIVGFTSIDGGGSGGGGATVIFCTGNFGEMLMVGFIGSSVKLAAYRGIDEDDPEFH